MKFTIERNWIDILGRIWVPPSICAQRKELSRYDISCMEMKINDVPSREEVENWLYINSGDFQEILDFHAIIGETEIPWKDPENELKYFDCWDNCEVGFKSFKDFLHSCDDFGFAPEIGCNRSIWNLGNNSKWKLFEVE